MAVKPSPAVGRVARALHAIAQAPEGQLGLAEIARRTGESKPTVHSLLLALDAEGFVQRREPGPMYALGAALVALGDAARGSVTVLDAVEPELTALRDDLDISAMAGTVDGDELVVLSARSVAHPFGVKVGAGNRGPYRAPIGPIYCAWSDPAVQHAWCDRSVPRLSAATRRAILKELGLIRHRGWSATLLRSTEGGGVQRSAASKRGAANRVYGEATDDDLESESLLVVGISAPVWNMDGSIASSLALVGFDAPISGRSVRGLATRLVESSARATVRLGGRPRTEGGGE